MDALITTKQVSEVTTLARSQIHEMARRGEFPRPVQLTQRRHAWRASEVEQWIKDRIQLRDSPFRDSPVLT